MLKKISNLGSSLSKVEQRSINGGRAQEPDCAAAFVGCDASYPNNHTYFENCMTSLGC